MTHHTDDDEMLPEVIVHPWFFEMKLMTHHFNRFMNSEEFSRIDSHKTSRDLELPLLKYIEFPSIQPRKVVDVSHPKCTSIVQLLNLLQFANVTNEIEAHTTTQNKFPQVRSTSEKYLQASHWPSFQLRRSVLKCWASSSLEFLGPAHNGPARVWQEHQVSLER